MWSFSLLISFPTTPIPRKYVWPAARYVVRRADRQHVQCLCVRACVRGDNECGPLIRSGGWSLV